MNLNILIGMAVLSVGSMFLESYLNSAGKPEHAKFANMFVTGACGSTAIVTLASLIKAIKSLG